MSVEIEWACQHCGNENFGEGAACTSCNFPREFTPIPRPELLERLRAMKRGSRQGNHIEADALLLRYINDREIAEAFADIDKWYS